MNVFLVFVGDDDFSRVLPAALNRSNSDDGRVKVMAFPPLGIQTLAPVLRQRGHPVRLFDTCHPEMKAEHIARAVAQEPPDVIALSFLSTTTYPAVKQMVVMVREDEPDRKRLVAYLVVEQAAAPSVSEMRRYLGAHLPAYMIPSAFVMLDELPTSPSGKVDRRRLPAPESARPELDQEFVAPRTAVEKMLAEHVKELSALQNLLYAHDRYALLLIFQAMDAAGKDGAIRHVMSGVNPQGCQVFSFKNPSVEELDHDFLWRTSRCLPERGRIGIFNRSYYEEVLIVRVHPEILRGENLPRGRPGDGLWERRYASINGLERHLHRNGTRIVKFFLHLSKDEQRRRFLARIDDPDKNWKFSRADLAERKFWKAYRTAYEACLGATSTRHAPWHVVPADDKLNARLIVSQIVLDALGSLDPRYPRPDAKRRGELRALRRQLER